MNLKEVKDALNKLPDDLLVDFYLTHDMASEDPEPKLGIQYMTNEEKESACLELYETEAMQKLVKFAKDVNNAAMKCAAAKLDEDLIEDRYCEDIE